MFASLKYIVLYILIIPFISCKKQAKIPVTNTQYSIEVHIDDFEDRFVYLYRLSPRLSKIDSNLVKNNIAYFQGEIDFPERYILTLKDLNGAKLFIAENDSIEIIIEKSDLKKSIIKGSKINNELISFQNKSNQITSKIESLFPDLQRARLNNDAESLENISNRITEIEEENIAYNFKYISQHPNSFLSAMILNDLSKREEIDTGKIATSYQLLSDEVKQSIASKLVEQFLFLQL